MARLLRREDFDITYHNSMAEAQDAARAWTRDYPSKEILVVQTLSGMIELWAAKAEFNGGRK